MVLHRRSPTRIFAVLEGKKIKGVHGGLLKIMKLCLVCEVPALQMIQAWEITQGLYASPVFTSFPRCLLLSIILQKCVFCNLYPTAELYPIDQTFPFFQSSPLLHQQRYWDHPLPVTQPWSATAEGTHCQINTSTQPLSSHIASKNIWFSLPEWGQWSIAYFGEGRKGRHFGYK